MHSEKSANCTNSLPLSQQPAIGQKQQLLQKKTGTDYCYRWNKWKQEEQEP